MKPSLFFRHARVPDLSGATIITPAAIIARIGGVVATGGCNLPSSIDTIVIAAARAVR